ncbi:MAG TPA: protein kinase [Blastocatellia bacterium]|nr:protein kinase [Blastocatellia bacterium]
MTPKMNRKTISSTVAAESGDTPTVLTDPSSVERRTVKHCRECGQNYGGTQRFCRRDGGVLEAATVSTSAGIKDLMVGRVLSGRYRLLEKVGEGGMGVVYKAQHVKMKRLAAVKLLSPDFSRNAEFIARFEREAEMASRLDHPNAVAIYDYGQAEDGVVYLAMKFISGQPLASVIDDGAPLSLDRVVNIVRQSAAALEAAHRAGLVHRDFKPQNVIVSRGADQSDWVEVVDFGLAKPTRVRANFDLTRRGFVLGTPDYMSPEQVSGGELDARSDIYSLALVAYEMTAGILPFHGRTQEERMIKRLLEKPRPFSLARPQLEVPDRVERVILKGLELNRELRYSTAAEFSAELSNAVDLDRRYQPATLKVRSSVRVPAQTIVTPLTDRAAPRETHRTPDAATRSRQVRARIAMSVALVLLVGITILWRTPVAGLAGPVPVEQLSSESSSRDAQNALQSQTATVSAGSGSTAIAAKGSKNTNLRRQTATVSAGSGSTAGAATGVAPNTDEGPTPTPNPGPSPADAQDHVKQGLEFSRAGAYEEAIAQFAIAHRLEPSNDDVNYLMGLAYERINRPEEALSHYRMCSSGVYAKLSIQHVKRLSKRMEKTGGDD